MSEPSIRTRQFRMIFEFEVNLEGCDTFDAEVQQIFKTELGKNIDVHLLKSNIEWIDQQTQEYTA
jgi:hypothetical protein